MMKFVSFMGNSFGCSASGERLVSAARDGDFQEAKFLLECNPRLVRYSTFGVRNSPLHYSAAQGHHEVVSLLLESGVDINLRNYRGQTALMQACQHGHWEVVQVLILFKANIHRADYLNGGTALHLAALNGHTRCIRLLLADYIPSIASFWSIMQRRSEKDDWNTEFNESALHQVIDTPADGGITALHMAALNGHFETVHFLLDLGASVSEKTAEDGSTTDPIGAGSTPLHYAACGGNAQSCQLLISRGASLSAENALGWTPLIVARSWGRDWLEEILCTPREVHIQTTPSPFLCLPLMSIVKIARDSGWRNSEMLSTCQDPCVLCLEQKCTVAAGGCCHEFCTHCALYLCSTNGTSSVAEGPPGSVSCPLCRHGIVFFVKLPGVRPNIKESNRSSLSLSFCTCSYDTRTIDSTSLMTPFYRRYHFIDRLPHLRSSFRSFSCKNLSSVKLNSTLCKGNDEICPSFVMAVSSGRHQLSRCSRFSFQRASSHAEGRKPWSFPSRRYIC